MFCKEITLPIFERNHDVDLEKLGSTLQDIIVVLGENKKQLDSFASQHKKLADNFFIESFTQTQLVELGKYLFQHLSLIENLSCITTSLNEESRNLCNELNISYKNKLVDNLKIIHSKKLTLEEELKRLKAQSSRRLITKIFISMLKILRIFAIICSYGLWLWLERKLFTNEQKNIEKQLEKLSRLENIFAKEIGSCFVNQIDLKKIKEIGNEETIPHYEKLILVKLKEYIEQCELIIQGMEEYLSRHIKIFYHTLNVKLEHNELSAHKKYKLMQKYLISQDDKVILRKVTKYLIYANDTIKISIPTDNKISIEYLCYQIECFFIYALHIEDYTVCLLDGSYVLVSKGIIIFLEENKGDILIYLNLTSILDENSIKKDIEDLKTNGKWSFLADLLSGGGIFINFNGSIWQYFREAKNQQSANKELHDTKYFIESNFHNHDKNIGNKDDKMNEDTEKITLDEYWQKLEPIFLEKTLPYIKENLSDDKTFNMVVKQIYNVLPPVLTYFISEEKFCEFCMNKKEELIPKIANKQAEFNKMDNVKQLCLAE